MRTGLALLFLFIAGPGLLALGIWNLRTRAWHDGVPVLELLIDRAGGVEPPGRTATDRRLARLHGWMGVIFGSFFTLALAAVIFSLVA